MACRDTASDYLWMMSLVCCWVLSLRNLLQALHCQGLWTKRTKSPRQLLKSSQWGENKNPSSLILRIRMAAEGARWTNSAEDRSFPLWPHLVLLALVGPPTVHLALHPHWTSPGSLNTLCSFCFISFPCAVPLSKPPTLQQWWALLCHGSSLCHLVCGAFPTSLSKPRAPSSVLLKPSPNLHVCLPAGGCRLLENTDLCAARAHTVHSQCSCVVGWRMDGWIVNAWVCKWMELMDEWVGVKYMDDG